MRSPTKTNPNSRSLALVPLENISAAAADESPVPLSIFDPKKISRRSQRLNPSPLHACLKNAARLKSLKRGFSSTPDLSLGRFLSNNTSLRRSPRFLQPNSASKAERKFKKSKLMSLNSNLLRKSPRLSGLEPEVSSITAMPTKRKRGILGKCEIETPDAKLLKRSSRFDSINGGDVKCGLIQDGKANGQCSTYKVEEDEEVKNVEGMVQKISSRKLDSPKKGNFHAFSLTVFNAEKDLSRKLDVEQSSFSQHEEIQGATVSLGSETSNLEVRLAHKMVAEPSHFSLCENDDEEPTLVSCNSYLADERLLRRSTRSFSESKYSCNAESCSEFDMQIEKQLRRSPRYSSSSSLCGVGNISKSSDNQTTKLRNSPQPSISACRAKSSKSSHASIVSLKSDIKHPLEKIRNSAGVVNKENKSKMASFFVGDPVPADEAQQRWKWRYEMKSQNLKGPRMTENGGDDEDMVVVNVDCHYTKANIANSIFSLGDCVYIEGEGEKNLVGRIVEFFKTTDGDNYFRGQWFYRVEDTVIQEEGTFHDQRRLFYSTVMNDNPIDCILSKVSITQRKPRVGLKQNTASSFDYYYDMEYCVDYSTFRTLTNDESPENHVTSPTNSTETSCVMSSINSLENNPKKPDLELLDLYSGCGGMSTGLCLGAKHSSVNLIARWAVDSRKSACDSLKLNHPETHVRNESAEDFLELLKQWEKLCRRYKANDVERTRSKLSNSKLNSPDDKIPSGELEVSSLVDICYGDLDRTGKHGLNFKVHWKGYGSSEDTWEPFEGLSNCQEAIKDFVRRGSKSKILPLPGDVEIICGGPPCQGISGYNRFRNIDSPMDDERNRQIVIFMDIVKFLRPKFVLMENVTDILRFDKASLGRYALSRLVHMNYQARLGTIAAGCYGLPQFRLRVFLWGAQPGEKLPQFPLPTHEVIVRYWPPSEFERNTVAYDEEQTRKLEKAVLIQDAISDLPAVLNSESREEMPYEKPPETEFQRYIRSSQYEMMGCGINSTTMTKDLLYDHRPYLLSEDDYLRVCSIPKRKGANFRDLPGVVVGNDNVARRDVKSEVLLPSGKPMIPDYAFTFEQGKSRRPFGRLWWDETVATVVTFPSCHNQVALHPEQDRILTVREYARLQGFPDYYRFCGTVKERYRQVGNAVAVSVSRALGYCLGLAFRRLSGNEPLVVLPPKFSLSNYIQLQNQVSSSEREAE